MFTITTVRTRGSVHFVRHEAGNWCRELHEFGESVRARPDEVEGPSLALRRPNIELARKCKMTAEPRRRIALKKAARSVERREEQQSGGGDDPDREEPPTRRHRVARAVVQLGAHVALTSKTGSDQCWDVTLFSTVVVSVMSASQSCKNNACKTT